MYFFTLELYIYSFIHLTDVFYPNYKLQMSKKYDFQTACNFHFECGSFLKGLTSLMQPLTKVRSRNRGMFYAFQGKYDLWFSLRFIRVYSCCSRVFLLPLLIELFIIDLNLHLQSSLKVLEPVL